MSSGPDSEVVADPVLRPHAGEYNYHDDDCLCSMGDLYCNRGGHCWTCCGACKENSDCSRPETHPTHWNHPRFSETHSGEWKGNWPVYKSNAAIRTLMPELFAD